jgi:alpha-L-fucosidase
MKHPGLPIRAILCLAALSVGSALLAADPAAAISPVPETTEQHEARLAWWREARFGLFIHWGLYAIPARGEWVQWNEQIPNEEYAKLADQFRPIQFDPDAWAQLARDAGMNYVVLTARHHDGFALFDDPESDFTSVKTAARRDFVADYARAVRAAGLRVGLYYSPLDWRFPGYVMPDIQRKSAEAMRAQYHRQMRQLMSHYGALDVIWFDGGESDWLNFGADWKGAEWKKRPRDQHYRGGFNWEHAKVYAELRRLQPQALINGRADMPEDFRSREGDKALGDFDAEHPWELCTTLVKGAWGWQPGAEVKSLAYLVPLLVKAAGRDGNFLLNVGPRPDGTIDPAQAERLREIGTWLKANGESIYGTRGGPWLPGEYGVSTHRGNTIYVHVLQWGGPKLTLPALPSKVLNASRLDGGQVSFVQDGRRLDLTVPAEARNAIDTIIKLEVAGSAVGLTPLPVSETQP